MKKFLLFLAVFITAPIYAQSEPLWPLGINISQSSSFAEFRGLRFHAGIDLRTQRQTGFPVRAIADGFISRIKVQYRGYGYALYIDHPELKKRVVYGHLQDFAGAPADYTRKKLRKIGQRFGIDDFFGPDKFPVKKGQVVALSGETGSGPPHLHFEVRNLADEPEAPALLGFRPKDRIYPVFHHFYLEPMSFPCEINGSFLPFKARVKKKNTSLAKLEGSISVSGRVGVKIGVSDNNGVGNVFGVETIELSFAEKPVFKRNFHRYSYAQNSECRLVYDYVKSNQKGTGYVINMFKLPAETLPFAKEFKAWSGLLNSGESRGQNSLGIRISDFGHNEVNFSAGLTMVNADYDEAIPEKLLSQYKFQRWVQNSYSLVLVGERADKAKMPFSRGYVEGFDSKGKKASLPCIISDQLMEVAVPVEERWQNGLWLNKTRVLPELSLVNSSGKTISMADGGRIEFADNSLDFSIFASFKKIRENPPRGGSKKSGWLKPYSAVWKIEPEEVVFAKDVRILLKPQDFHGKNLQQLGIYKVTAGGRYSHVGEKIENGWLVAETRLGGEWVLLEDKVPPSVSYKGKGKDYHLGKIWKFKVGDLGEGVNYLGASATIDGKKAELYSDPDKSEIYVVRNNVSKSVKLNLKIPDYAGNVRDYSRKL